MPAPQSVVLDAQGAQNRAHFDRGIPRFVTEQLRAVLAAAPEAVRSVALNPVRPLSGNLLWLVGSGLAQWSVPGERPAEPPALYHVMSPFELDRSLAELWPDWVRSGEVRTVVTLYDLIPLVFESHYLRDPAGRAHYLARAELVRAADQVLAISQTTAADAERLLGVEERRITVVDAGVTSRFLHGYTADEPAWRVLRQRLPVLRAGFMLYVSGIEFRKNNERLISAYGRWPAELRRRHQLVIACSMRDEARAALEAHARAQGIAPDELVMPGYVSDGELAALYRLCRLFVFASFYEGSGLPILEAMAAGSPVAAAQTATSPEILGDTEATFDPFDEGAIADCLAAVITDDTRLARLRERSARRVGRYTWEHVAERSVAGYDRALAHGRRRPRRRRIAWFSPWPPQQTGIANYSARIVAEIGHAADVDVIVEGTTDGYAQPLERGVRLVSADDLDLAVSLRQYDALVYCLGNSGFHDHVIDAMRVRRGTVLAHDVRLIGFWGTQARREWPDDPWRLLAHWLRLSYGERIDASLFAERPPSPDEQAALGLFLTGTIQECADRLIVHSAFAADVLRLDRPPEIRSHAPITVLPLAMRVRPERERPEVPARPVIASFGVLSEVKGLATLIDGFALVAATRPGATLVLAGPADPAELDRWTRYADEAGVGEQVEIPGFVEDAGYERLLAHATLAVQMRTVTQGEASAAVADCMGAGLPTIVTDLGWAQELPSGVVERVPVDVTPAALAATLERLLIDRDERARMAQAARAYAAELSYARVAQRLLETLRLTAR
jgi:glycosyltransferase involved in cell wall biosynthesis